MRTRKIVTRRVMRPGIISGFTRKLDRYIDRSVDIYIDRLVDRYIDR